jgi:hypothetical protein
MADHGIEYPMKGGSPSLVKTHLTNAACSSGFAIRLDHVTALKWLPGIAGRNDCCPPVTKIEADHSYVGHLTRSDPACPGRRDNKLVWRIKITISRQLVLLTGSYQHA